MIRFRDFSNLRVILNSLDAISVRTVWRNFGTLIPFSDLYYYLTRFARQPRFFPLTAAKFDSLSDFLKFWRSKQHYDRVDSSLPPHSFIAISFRYTAVVPSPFTHESIDLVLIQFLQQLPSDLIYSSLSDLFVYGYAEGGSQGPFEKLLSLLTPSMTVEMLSKAFNIRSTCLFTRLSLHAVYFVDLSSITQSEFDFDCLSDALVPILFIPKCPFIKEPRFLSAFERIIAQAAKSWTDTQLASLVSTLRRYSHIAKEVFQDNLLVAFYNAILFQCEFRGIYINESVKNLELTPAKKKRNVSPSGHVHKSYRQDIINDGFCFRCKVPCYISFQPLEIKIH